MNAFLSYLCVLVMFVKQEAALEYMILKNKKKTAMEKIVYPFFFFLNSRIHAASVELRGVEELYTSHFVCRREAKRVT